MTLELKVKVNRRALGPMIAHLNPGTLVIFWPLVKEISFKTGGHFVQPS